MNPIKEQEDAKDDFAKGIACFWRSTNLEPHIRSVALCSGISKVALGNSHTLLLTFNSELLSVGDNSFGQLGLGDLKPRREPTVVDYFRDKRVVEICCGGQHSGVICANNEVFFWGDSSSGQCGIGDTKLANEPSRVLFERYNSVTRETHVPVQQDKESKKKEALIIQIAGGDSHSLALSTEGEVWSWGTGCQLGHGIETDKVTHPKQIELLVGKHVTSVSCGAYHSLAVIQGDRSYPTFMLSGSDTDRDMTSQPAKTPKRVKIKNKQRKLSKGSAKKSHVTGKHEHHRALKADAGPDLSNFEKSSVTRTYLSYEPVITEKGAESVSGIMANKPPILEHGQNKEKDLNKEKQNLDSLDDGNLRTVVDSKEEAEVAHNSSLSESTYSDVASLEETMIEKYVNINCEQTDSSLETQFVVSVETLGANENISNSSPDDCSSLVSPSSPTSATSITYFASTDSDSEDSVTKVCQDKKLKKTGVIRRNSSGFYSAIGSRLIRPDVNLSKLTSAVVGSVTGMFMTSVPAGKLSLSNPPGAVMVKMPCKQCGLLGLCLCDGDGTKFKMAGANTQVWSWGRGGCGQLGLGDTEDRFYPCCVKELNDVGVIKLAAGTFHSLAQTVCSQVFSWGDNSCGQLGRKKTMALQPKKIRCFSDVLIWDIAAGSHYSLFIGDMAISKPDVYVCGRQPSAMPSVAATMNSIRESRSLPSLASDDGTTATPVKATDKRVLSPSHSFDDTKERSLQHSRVEIVRLTMFRTVGQLWNVTANTEHCACLAGSDKSGKFEIMSELASKERLFYYQLALIWQAVLTPLLQSEVWSCLALQEMGQVLAPVIQSFYGIMKCVSTSLTAVTQLVVSMKSFHELFELCWSDEFLQAFERYSECFSNGVAFGVFKEFSNVSSDITSQSRAVLSDILDDTAQEFVSYDNAFQYMMQFPLLKMQHYKLIVGKLHSTLQISEGNIVDCARLKEEAERWEQLITEDENKQAKAERTQTFWRDCPSKVSEIFKHPHRRLLRSSHLHSLFPAKGTRFSTPLFVLFDDFFVHYQSAKTFQAFPLATVWAEGIDNTEGVINGIKITTPEEILLVCAPSTVDKADWLITINHAIASVISKTTTYRLGVESLNKATGSLAPAVAREASFTYEHDSVYRGATYYGMWLLGKPHGHGEMHWSDGRHYTGEFKHGVQHGEGIMIFPPNFGENSGEKYEGQWRDGKMSGYGKLSFSNGDMYVGHWVDNQRSGHGSMKSGAMSPSGATLYIGEWQCDKRSGYGVIDDILRGEKYMGMWETDCRHGLGVLVTLDGIYNQGIFVQNKLSGDGVLLCDDNTKFEGEFVGECLLSGKGVLTMPNGDYIEGTFTGQWGEGIRINGTFHKLEATSTVRTSPRSTVTNNKDVIPPEKKWISLFSQCRKALGCSSDRDPDLKVVWQSISVALKSKRDSKLSHGDQEILQDLLNINSEMEQSAKVTAELPKVQLYLSKAFDIKQHPLGQLVNGLIDVFRASYVGMGTHRRLLPHAVAEVKSFVVRVYNVVRLLFPELPNEEYVYLHTDTVSGVASHGTEESLTSSMLMHPLLFPRLYPPLFTLYALENDRADSAYWERIQQLNKRSDWALMTYVGMQRQFWLTNEQDVGSRSDEVKLENRQPEHYISAIESLQQISTKFSPMEKLGVLKTTFEQINKDVGSFWQGEKKLMSLDDLFPVFQFVVIRARIPHLGSEIQFIEDMVDSHVHVGEQGHMFTTLKESDISYNGRMPLLHADENSIEDQHDVEDSTTSKRVGVGRNSNSLSYSASLESGHDSAGSVISYHNICYSINTKVNRVKTEKQIIKNLSGIMEPGLNAILGPTGSGKTTLLDILAGRKDRKHLSGHVLVNGVEQPNNFKCITGYVVQEDVVMGTLTVRENLHFSAALRLPGKLSKHERDERVDATLSDLGLFHVAESKVGNEFIRGISGGERKRTNIGMELIMSPSVLFLDEPTTGLDASTAVSVIQLLQGLGRRGKTVIMSIHQPRYSIFKTFDTISLLSNGEFVYQGPAAEAIKYFEDIGFICEEHNNPADFFMDVIFDSEAAQRHGFSENSETTVLSLEEGHSSLKPLNLPEMYRNSKYARKILQTTQPILEEFSTSVLTVGFSNEKEITYATSFFSQLATVSGRAIKNIIRNPQTSVLQFFTMVIFGVIVGAIYYQLKKDKHGIQNRVGVFFFLVMNMIFGNLSAVELFIKERPIFIHESASGYYRISVYFLAKVVCDLIPMRLVPIIGFSAIVYFMTGLDPHADKFLIFTLTLLLTSLCACSVAFFVSACVRTFAIANLLIALPYVFMMVFGGVLVNLNSVLDWLSWIKYISIFRYAIEVRPRQFFFFSCAVCYIVTIFMMGYSKSPFPFELHNLYLFRHLNQSLEINELHGMKFDCTRNDTITGQCVGNGDEYLELQSISVDNLWYNEIALASMTAILMFFTYIALRLIKKEK